MRNGIWATGIVLSISLVASSRAHADDHRIEFDSLARDLGTYPPDAGRDTAPLRAPQWCSDVVMQGSPSPGSIGRAITSAAQYSNGWEGFFQAAEMVCHFPNETAVQKAAQIIEQHWINLTGQSEADALASFRLRLHADTMAADKEKLCTQLTVSDELSGEEKEFMTARRQLFGCNMGQQQPFWSDIGTGVGNELITYLDNSETPPDQFVILANVLSVSRGGLHDDITDRRLVNYVIDQYDYSLLNPSAAKQELDTPPYAGNSYARAVISESLGVAKFGIAGFEAAIAKKSSDADWKELLITSPQRGLADWNRAAAAHKDALADSDAFEHKFWGPSRKALAGCWEPLRKEFVDVAGTLKHGSAVEFREALSDDPVASLLFRRLAACGTVDTEGPYAKVLVALTKDLRFSRGPRYAAYYSAFDTLSKILDDRTKFPVTMNDLRRFQSGALYDASLRGGMSESGSSGGRGHGHVRKAGASDIGFVGDSGKGVVKRMKKGGDGLGVQIDFVTEKHQEMGRDCRDTNHIETFRPDGSPMYRQSCHDTGLITVNTTPGSITVPTEWSANIKPGSYVEFDSMIGKAPDRIALPKVVYSDKSKKKLVNWYGFEL